MPKTGKLSEKSTDRPELVTEPFVFESRSRSYLPRKAGNRNGRRRGIDKEFIAWDGEGWTEHHYMCDPKRSCLGWCQHHYYLFGNSKNQYATAQSLKTSDCLDVMLKAAKDFPTGIHVSFAFTYDVNMILRDVPIGRVRRLVKERSVHWAGYRLEWIPKKWFQVTGIVDGEKITCRIQDIFSYFGSSFISVLKDWEIGDEQQRKMVEAGKAARGDFELSSLDALVLPYWHMEIQLLATLAESLREVLASGGFHPDQWYGPGALASSVYLARGTEGTMLRDVPEGVIDAAQYSYAGGRFEGFRAGYYEGTIYSADINSAYPYALSKLPNLATGEWHYRRFANGLSPYSGERLHHRLGMFHVRYKTSRYITERAVGRGWPLPIFHRSDKGTITYPPVNDVWVHVPEMNVLMDLLNSRRPYFDYFEVLEEWVFEDDGTYPFHWVADLYAQRSEWKAAGNPAQLAAKLVLNSLYGKLAQRTGGRDGNIPRWHQLEWAGAITSECRAMLFEAGAEPAIGGGLIAFETDGIYSAAPFGELPNGVGEDLGQWKVDIYSGMLFLQNGVYWLRDENGEWLPPKSRGIPRQHLSIEAARVALRDGVPLEASQTQFIGFSLADMRRRYDIWRTWQTNRKSFVFGGAGKRIHVPTSVLCGACRAGKGQHEALHYLSVLSDHSGPSVKHPLPWRDSIRAIEEGIELFAGLVEE